MAATPDDVFAMIVFARVVQARSFTAAGGHERRALLVQDRRRAPGRRDAADAHQPQPRLESQGRVLRTTPRVQMDPERVTRMVNDLGDPDPILRAGDAYGASLDGAARAAHEIQGNDGL